MDTVRVGIHQPNFLPWLGYFAKAAASDVFILLDDAQYTKNGYINRNRIRTRDGELWLTVPASATLETPIRAVRIVQNRGWASTHLKTLRQSYGKAPGFERAYAIVEEAYGKGYELLCDLNRFLLQRAFAALGIERRVLLASDFGIASTSSERLVALVKAVGGTSYVSGKGGSSYQDEAAFAGAGIGLEYIKFEQAEYPQVSPGFVPNLSVIDYLMSATDASAWKPSYRLSPDRHIYDEPSPGAGE